MVTGVRSHFGFAFSSVVRVLAADRQTPEIVTSPCASNACHTDSSDLRQLVQGLKVSKTHPKRRFRVKGWRVEGFSFRK